MKIIASGILNPSGDDPRAVASRPSVTALDDKTVVAWVDRFGAFSIRARWSSAHLAAALLAAGVLAPPGASADEPVTHLFTGWYGIDAGTTVHKVNRANVDPKGLDIIRQVTDWYRQSMAVADGDFPPERVCVPTGVVIRAEIPKKTEPWFVPDKPWETGEVSVERVIQEGGLYRVWYSAQTKGSGVEVKVMPDGRKKLAFDGEGLGGLCYMESSDAVHWVKPRLGLVEFHGSKDNNIMTADPRIGGAIFIDREAPPAERYKTVANVPKRFFDPKTKAAGPVIAGAVSPDGIHWKVLPEPLWHEVFNNDGSPEVHRDEETGKYVMYMRANYPRRRSIARAETYDFRHWPYPVIILTPGPDDDPSTDYYDNPFLQYPGAPSAQLMLVSSFHRDLDTVDMRMATSIDGDGWNWLSPRPVVPVGPPGSWDGGMVWACADMVRLPDGRIAVVTRGDSERHNEVWRATFERHYRTETWHTAWLVWEDGRIAGAEAKKGGEFTTLALKASGQPIEINARTGFSGSIQVDVLLEEQGGPFPTLALRARPVSGDLRWQPLVFPKGNLSELAGKNIRLRFHLYNAKVFGVRGAGLAWARSTRMSPPQL